MSDRIETFIVFLITRKLLIELFVQFFRLWRLKQIYERNSKSNLPELDYRTDDGYHDEASPGKLVLLQLILLEQFLTPWMALSAVSSNFVGAA